MRYWPKHRKMLIYQDCCGSGTRTPITCSRGMCPTIRRTRTVSREALGEVGRCIPQYRKRVIYSSFLVDIVFDKIAFRFSMDVRNERSFSWKTSSNSCVPRRGRQNTNSCKTRKLSTLAVLPRSAEIGTAWTTTRQRPSSRITGC